MSGQNGPDAAERARRGGRQDDLAERMGWRRWQVSDLENDKRIIDASDLPLLCRAFEMTLAELGAHAESGDLDALLWV